MFNTPQTKSNNRTFANFFATSRTQQDPSEPLPESSRREHILCLSLSLIRSPRECAPLMANRGWSMAQLLLCDWKWCALSLPPRIPTHTHTHTHTHTRTNVARAHRYIYTWRGKKRERRSKSQRSKCARGLVHYASHVHTYSSPRKSIPRQ